MFSPAAIDKKGILLIGVCLLSVIGPVSAYQVYLSCPEAVQAGLPLNCSVESNLPAGTMFDVAFYQSATLLSRISGTIDGNHSTWYQSFGTRGLSEGLYKVEVQFPGPESGKLSSDSTTLQVPRLIDRSGDITITSPGSQTFEEALRIEGSMVGLGTQGIEIEVRGPDGFTSGPEFIDTRMDFRTGGGMFTRRIAIPAPGTYHVTFIDENRYTGTKTFTVLPFISPAPTTIPATTPATTRLPTTVPFPSLPATTPRSPLSLFSSLGALFVLGLVAIWIGKRI